MCPLPEELLGVAGWGLVGFFPFFFLGGVVFQLAPSVVFWYLWVFILFVSCKPAVPLHSWSRSEAACWQGRRGGEEECSLGALGFAALGTADELELF